MIAVTKLIDILNKPALMKWSNKIGLQGIKLEDYRKEASSSGTSKHKQIEDYLINGIPFEESDRLDHILECVEVVGVEMDLDNGYICGRCDLLCKIGEDLIVVDFKSSSQIYLSHKLQLSAYMHILKADKVAIINFNTWELEILDIDTARYWSIIKYLYGINEKLTLLNERL